MSVNEKKIKSKAVSSIVVDKSDIFTKSSTTKLAIDNNNLVSNVSNEHKTPDMCITAECKNMAISHPEWDNEYCSISCCYNHCKTTFKAWLTTNKSSKVKTNTASSTDSVAGSSKQVGAKSVDT